MPANTDLRFHRRKLTLAVLLSLSSVGIANAAEQAGADSSAKPANRVTLKKLIVTAQHRSEDIQEVPVAVTAVETEHVAETGLRNYDLFTFVPNAAAENPDGESRPRIYIRGLGTGDTAASTVFPVGVYADGVYLNAPIAAGGALFDLDRVEVLRGPQGTLYGKNTTGGAINYISKKPEFTAPTGHGTIGLGSKNQQTYDAALGGTIIDDVLAGRVALYKETRDGFTKNLQTDKYVGGIDKEAARVQFLLRPTESFDALLKLHYRDYDDNGSNGSLPTGTYNAGTPISYTRKQGRYIDTRVPQEGEIKHRGASLTLNKFFGDYQLASITAYDKIENRALGGGGSNPREDNSRTYTNNTWEQQSQEFRLISPQASTLRWIAGLHYFHEDLDSTNISTRYQQALAQLPPPLVAQDPVVSRNAPGYRDISYSHETTSYAAYGNVTYDFTEQFSITAGLRWSSETKDLDIDLTQYTTVNFINEQLDFWRTSSLAGSPVPNIRQHRSPSETWDDWTYDITPEYRINENARVFFRYAHGFRSGAFNVGVSTSLDPVLPVDPEYLDSYELGVKSEWLDGRLRANANVFYYDYTDIQANLLTPTPSGGVVTSLANGPKAEAKGAELELDAQATDNLRLRLTAAWLEATYTDFVDRNPSTGAVTDNTGNRLVRSPKLTLAVGVDYTFRLDEYGQIIASTDVSYRDKEYFLVDKQDDSLYKPLMEDGYSVWNARLTYVSPNNTIRVAGYVNNINDTLYQVHGRPNGSSPSNAVITYGNPLTYGVSLTYNF